ncbi:MAG TPA: hypothetical protein IAC25_02685 [Candidatus Enterenecus stercoripullorum]|nr:hypothetical protein [Candidatus Enterenecus stercoripullorum]
MKKITLSLLAAALLALSACTGSFEPPISFDPPGSATETPDEQESSQPSQDDSGDVITPDEDGYAMGYLGDTLDTAFFDFTINSAYTCEEFDGLTAQEDGVNYLTEFYGRPAPAGGCKFLVVEITLHNNTLSTQPMTVVDFQVQWDVQEGDDPDENYAFPLCRSEINADGEEEYVSLSEQQLPASYDLGINEERTGILLYAVPAGARDYAIYFEEYFADDTVGDLFRVSFNAEEGAQ